MVVRNENIGKLKAGYLFPEINRRKKRILADCPDANIISLSIGNTTQPLKEHIAGALHNAAKGLGTEQGYSGYGDEQGQMSLRAAIAEKVYNNRVDAQEVFVSDGAKCDIGRLQTLFGADVRVAVQDPAYPVYVDGSVLIGATGEYDDDKSQFGGITYMPCTKENGFFPDLEGLPDVDIIYFCSPNNPTGAAATREQLEKLVGWALENKSIIIFDGAYSEFIQDDSLPKTIYEIEGAKKVAIEVNSFSKPAGFTGVRLGWSVCPRELEYDDGLKVIDDWNRVTCTVFNGASNIAQRGGLAALDEKGIVEMRETIGYYLSNARIIRDALDEMGIESYGGDNAPYIWAYFEGRKSWDVFEEILEKAHVITTPGAGFGPSGEGYIRFSAFGSRQDTIQAMKRIKEMIA
jgi:LL-diaminopimelate aminotransferase